MSAHWNVLCRMLVVFVTLALYVGLGPWACIQGWTHYVNGLGLLYIGLGLMYDGLGLIICWVGPIDQEGLGPLLCVVLNVRAKPNDMYGMCYFGELIKICAYNFIFMVLGTSSSKEKDPT